MAMHAKPRENLLVLYNKFNFATLNSFLIDSKRCVLVLSWL